MAIEKLQIESFVQLAKQHPVIDVRSPGEYNHAHIPAAYSLPLFSDEERKVVGTTYKQQSREAAIKIGLDYFGPKMRKMVEEVEGICNRELGIGESHPNSKFLIPNSNTLLIYCWRGGMRSAGVAWLMDLYGFKVYTLIGGYKRFRNYVLDTFRQPFQFGILGGYTGSGKTEVLRELSRSGETIIDLEEIARHKGSAFGNIGMPRQPTQEMFENILAEELRSKAMNTRQLAMDNNSSHSPLSTLHSPRIWLEDESQRIGLVNIPVEIWNNMRRAPVYFLDVPFEERLNYLVHEYGNLDKEKMVDAIFRIQKRLGDLEMKNAVAYLEEGNTKECFRILLKYYDKFYLRGLHNRGNVETLLNKIKCSEVSRANAQKLLEQPEIHENP